MLDAMTCDLPRVGSVQHKPRQRTDGVIDLGRSKAGSAWRKGRALPAAPQTSQTRGSAAPDWVPPFELRHAKPENLFEVVVFACNNLAVDHQLGNDIKVVALTNVDAHV